MFACLKWGFVSFSKWARIFLKLWKNLAGWFPSSFLILLLCKTGKILWRVSTRQTIRCLEKLHLQFLISLFACLRIFWKVNRLGVFPLPRRDQNMCSIFTQVFSSPLFILIVNFWTYCNCTAASLDWCAVVILFRWMFVSFCNGIFFLTFSVLLQNIFCWLLLQTDLWSTWCFPAGINIIDPSTWEGMFQ